MTPRPRRLALVALVAGLTVALLSLSGGCGSDDPEGAAGPPRTIRVPSDHPTIQSGVDAARPGDLVLVESGVYRETVTVETPGLVIRGVDRTGVVVDGEHQRENGFKVFADGVAVENLTVRYQKGNGVLFTGDYGDAGTLQGYRAAYLTLYDNGLYGVYAFNARGGLIDHSYASGHPDAGFYIGQCFPCDAVVIDSVAELNAVGLQATNAGGNLTVARGVYRNNRVGIEPNSSTREDLYPQRGMVIVGNLVTANGDSRAPQATTAFGVGVVVAGGHANRIQRNRVERNPAAGIMLTAQEQFLPEGNRVVDNALGANGVDLVYSTPGGRTLDNCFAGNTFTTASPPGIEAALGCQPEAHGGTGSPAPVSPPPGPDYRTVEPPPPQPSMPDATTAPPQAVTTPSNPDPATFPVPEPA